MIAGVVVRNLNVFKDERGFLLKVVKQIDVGRENFGEIYISAAVPGAVKGNHYHKKQKEWFCVIRGKGKMVLEKDGERVWIDMDENSYISVEVPPDVIHAIKNTGEDMMYLLTYANRPYDPEDTDTFTNIVKFDV